METECNQQNNVKFHLNDNQCYAKEFFNNDQTATDNDHVNAKKHESDNRHNFAKFPLNVDIALASMVDHNENESDAKQLKTPDPVNVDHIYRQFSYPSKEHVQQPYHDYEDEANTSIVAAYSQRLTTDSPDSVFITAQHFDNMCYTNETQHDNIYNTKTSLFSSALNVNGTDFDGAIYNINSYEMFSKDIHFRLTPCPADINDNFTANMDLNDDSSYK